MREILKSQILQKFSWKPEVKIPLRRPNRKWNIKSDHKEIVLECGLYSSDTGSYGPVAGFCEHDT